MGIGFNIKKYELIILRKFNLFLQKCILKNQQLIEIF